MKKRAQGEFISLLICFPVVVCLVRIESVTVGLLFRHIHLIICRTNWALVSFKLFRF